MNGRRWVVLALAIGMVAVAGCDRLGLDDSDDDATSTPVVTALPPVGAGGEIEAEGKVVPVLHAALSFPGGGTVAKIVVEEGERVRAGQLLIRLDGAQQMAAVLLAEADLRAARARLAQVEATVGRVLTATVEGGVTSETTPTPLPLSAGLATATPEATAIANADTTEVDLAAAELEAARAGVDQAAARLEQALVLADQTQLLAPFAGTVAAIEVGPAEVVLPGVAVLQLADESAWQIETENLTELDIVGIEAGDEVTITLPAIPDLELTGKVVRVKPLGEARMGDVVYTVIVRPDRHEPRLRWNMTAEVTIAADDA